MEQIDAIIRDQVALHVFCSAPNITEQDVIRYEQCHEPSGPEVRKNSITDGNKSIDFIESL